MIESNQERINGEHVSVVVCYRNEEENITDSLEALVNQSDKNIEIVLVDDNSTDDTYERLKALENPRVKVIQNQKDHNGKKMALSAGIRSSSNEWLLMTDADCKMPIHWVETMKSKISNNKIVLGFAPLYPSNTIVGKFARYETYYTALQYLSFALAGRPYMGVGRNLMYHRSVFDDSGGFESHMDIASGDDDLIINYAANGNNTAICLDPNSFVYSQGKESLASFIRQKTRHISSAHKYRWMDKLLLGLSSITQIGLYLSAVILLFSSYYTWLQLLLYYWIFMLTVQYPICKKLHSMDLWLLYPIYDILMAIYYIGMIPFTFIKKQNTWS